MIRPVNANKVWLGLVLLHLAASFIAAFSSGIKGGTFFLSFISWFFFCICHEISQRVSLDGVLGPDKTSFLSRIRQGEISRKTFAMILAGFAFWLLLFFLMDDDGRMLVSINMMELAYAAWICCKAATGLGSFCGLGVPRKPWSLLLLVPAALLLFVISGYVNVLSMFFFKDHISGRLIEYNSSLAGSLISIALIPAIVEEIFFRGLLFRSLGGKWRAILVSAACFGLLHMNFNQMSYAFIMGIFFGWIVWKTGNLMTTMVIHGLFNSISILINYFGGPEQAESAAAESAGYDLMTLMAGSDDGRALRGILIVGLLMSVICAGLLYFLIRFYSRINGELHKQAAFSRIEEERGEQTTGFEMGRELEASRWKPSASFFAACIICLVYAVLIEWMSA